MLKKKWLKFVEYIYIILGSFITALSVVFFLNPAKIAAGGVSGIAIILFHTLNLDPGIMIFVLSFPLFVIGTKVFGPKFGLKSLLGTILLSGFIYFLNKIFGTEGFLNYSDSLNVLLSALYGGVVAGVGMGFVMKSGANTGGTDIIAQVIAKYTSLTLGTSLMLIDGLVIFSSIFVFGITNALYAIITVYVTGIMIDRVVLSGLQNYAKTVFIISKKNKIIQKRILEELEHGGTILSGTGMYSGMERPVIMTVVYNNKINYLTSIVNEEDKEAFMIVQNAYKVVGEGFVAIGDDK
ncbi:MAG: YitT family protein [Sphaerochaetaceae bacterium]|nr:YitT family protein [Sphaerochaetaceae bacterium]